MVKPWRCSYRGWSAGMRRKQALSEFELVGLARHGPEISGSLHIMILLPFLNSFLCYFPKVAGASILGFKIS